jgi:hypothetical protein
MAELSEARGRIAGAGESEDGEREDGAVEGAAKRRVGVEFHHTRFSAAKAAFFF